MMLRHTASTTGTHLTRAPSQRTASASHQRDALDEHPQAQQHERHHEAIVVGGADQLEQGQRVPGVEQDRESTRRGRLICDKPRDQKAVEQMRGSAQQSIGPDLLQQRLLGGHLRERYRDVRPEWPIRAGVLWAEGDGGPGREQVRVDAQDGLASEGDVREDVTAQQAGHQQEGHDEDERRADDPALAEPPAGAVLQGEGDYVGEGDEHETRHEQAGGHGLRNAAQGNSPAPQLAGLTEHGRTEVVRLAQRQARGADGDPAKLHDCRGQHERPRGFQHSPDSPDDAPAVTSMSERNV